jgi:hypothetical protein
MFEYRHHMYSYEYLFEKLYCARFFFVNNRFLYRIVLGWKAMGDNRGYGRNGYNGGDKNALGLLRSQNDRTHP